MSIETFSEEAKKRIRASHERFEGIVRASSPGQIDNEDSPEKVALRKKILSSPEFREEYEKRAVGKIKKS
jgi:hypothetical protein